MSSVSSGNYSQIAGSYTDTTAVYSKSDVAKTDDAGGKKKVSGQTIGNPQLSEKASKYYEQLKKKYSNMNFILVSEDQKENAKANAAGYANANNMVVLIDEDKIEKMASDENYRKQYEGIIANAASGMSQLASSISATGTTVKGYGMQVNDNGTASYFAVLEKSSAAQKERIEKHAEDKKEAKKAAEKKAEKKKNQERLEKKRNETGDVDDTDDTETVTVTASSIEELLEKIKDQQQLFLSDTVRTAQEKNVGQNVDFSGGSLAPEEISYLEKNDPAALKKYRETKEEKEDYKEKLRQCRTKEEVDRVKLQKLGELESSLSSVVNDPAIPKSAKLAKAQEILAKTNNIETAHLEFVKSAEYQSMPTEEEKKEQEAADNEISGKITSDEITDSKKADDAEITDTSDSTQNKADNVTDDNNNQVSDIENPDTMDTNASEKTSEKDNHKKEYSTEIRKVTKKLKEGFEAADMHVDIIV